MLFQFNLGKTVADAQKLIGSTYGENAVSEHVESGFQNLEVVISICLVNHVLEGPMS